MKNSTENELKKRLQKDDELYLRFAINLEQEHKGEFVVKDYQAQARAYLDTGFDGYCPVRQ